MSRGLTSWQNGVVNAHHGQPDSSAEALQQLVQALIEQLGEDVGREGLRGTPERAADSLTYLTGGYGIDLEGLLGDALFEQQYDEMVLVKNVQFYSLCEHHLLPFFGAAHVAYLPHGRVLGLSKIPRVVDVFARRLQLQERMTREIAEALLQLTGAKGVAVVIEARHLCMEMRGVEKVGGQTVTSCMLGVFRSDARTRGEFLNLIGR
ncbi:MAG: GTP cyclohydrolase I FolE [Candidatus Dormibacteraeota bacterium]|uniref:GTP cyclohydrolase 1 n=1 Tax=Candidatus Dormiibacter inghamiae TaxID=3127013 RepID=A0A934KHY1_9BACT|nr:GTP cyclohydrolase I FolE [Candidatus Dormibacteraeota bacterium]MBJ7606272.1 GTP cyclohydrolase I FolE [Candidatus Dormibacteraeota bacterium]